MRIQYLQGALFGNLSHNGCTRARRAGDRHRSTVERDDGFHNRQPEPEALRVAATAHDQPR